MPSAFIHMIDHMTIDTLIVLGILFAALAAIRLLPFPCRRPIRLVYCTVPRPDHSPVSALCQQIVRENKTHGGQR